MFLFKFFTPDLMGNRSQIPEGQTWLVDKVKTILPQVREEGICLGVSHMAKQAILAGELDKFLNRIKLIEEIKQEGFKEYINSIEQKRINIIKEVKERENLNSYRKINDFELKKMLNKNEIEKILESTKEDINNLIKEGKLLEMDGEFEFTQQANLNLFKAYTQKKIEEAVLSLSPVERETLEIPVFFQGVDIYHQTDVYPELFEKKPHLQDPELAVKLLASKKNEEKGIDQTDAQLSGIYNESELLALLNDLMNRIKKASPPIKQPISFILRDCGHAICVGYDPSKGSWSFVDANQIKNHEENMKNKNLKTKDLASKILTAFSPFSMSKDDKVAFTMEVYANNDDKLSVSQCVTELKQSPNFKKLHDISSKKDSRDSNGATWLFVAANRGYEETVNELLAAGADPNLVTNKRVSPLSIAVQNRHYKVVEALLKYKANPNIASVDGATPLFIAAQLGNSVAVEMLLKVEGIDTTIPFKIKPGPLRKFGEKYHIETVALEKFIESKTLGSNDLSQDILITPKEMAHLMGRDDIEKMLIEHENKNLYQNQQK